MKHSSKLRYGPLPFTLIDMHTTKTFLMLRFPTPVGFLDLISSFKIKGFLSSKIYLTK